MKKILLFSLMVLYVWLSVHLKAHSSYLFNYLLTELFFDGLLHESSGEATLTEVGDALIIQNIGSTGADGVNINLGETKGFGFVSSLSDPENSSLGSYKEWTMYGELGNQQSQKLWTERHQVLEINGQRTNQIFFDSSPLGTQENFIKVYDEEDNLLYENTFPNGPIYRINCGCPFFPQPITLQWDATCVASIDPGTIENTSISFPNGDRLQGTAARIETGPLNPTQTPSYCSLVESRAKDIRESQLELEQIAMFEERYYNRSLGGTRFNAESQGNQLTLANLGSTGKDGVAIDLQMAEEFYLRFAPMEANNPNATTEIRFSTIAYGPNEGEIPFGELTQTKSPDNDFYLIETNFETLGNPSVFYEFIGPNGISQGELGPPFFGATKPIRAIGKISGAGRPLGIPCYFLEFEEGNVIDIRGTSMEVQKLYVLANVETGVTNMADFIIQTKNIPQLTIVNESTNINDCQELPDCKNRALRFDGFGDYLQTTNLPISGTENFTIEAWVYPEDTDGLTGCDDNFDRIFGFGGDRFELGVCGGELSVVAGGTVGLQLVPMLNNQWYHVAAVRDGDNLKVYLNCEEVYNVNVGFSLGGVFRVGRWPGSGAQDENWEGLIEEFRIWNQARGIEELAFYKDCELSGAEENLVLYYNFNEGIPEGNNTSRTQVPDLSGNGNDGNIIGFNLNGTNSNYVCSREFSCQNCKANFSWIPIDECGNIQFINQSSGSGLSYQWDFDADGIVDSQDPAPSFQYLTSGEFKVCLTVSNANCESQLCQKIVISPDLTPPNAVCVGSFKVVVGDNCEYLVDPSLLDGGSNDNCGIATLEVDKPILGKEDLCQLTTVTLIVTDFAGNTAECTTSIFPDDLTPPQITCPNDRTVEPDSPTDPIFTGSPVVQDNCGAKVTFKDSFIPNAECPGSFERIWTATDQCGNEATCTQQILINCEQVDCENRALRFDGDGDFLQTDNLPISGTQDFTIEAWVFPEDSDGLTGCGGNFDRIFGFGGDRFEIGVCGGQLSIVAGGSTGLQLVPMLNNQWYHVAAVRQGNNLRVYLDCVEVYNVTSTFSLGGFFRVGRWPGSGALNETWEGLIDEFRIWDYPRNLRELNDFKSCELSGQELGLVLYYTFNEGIPLGNNTGLSVVSDLTGNGNDGNFSGFLLNGINSNFVCSQTLVCIPPLVCQPCSDERGFGPNLIPNADFSNDTVGFSSDLAYVQNGPLSAGQYSVRNSTNLGNTLWSATDHTTGNPLGSFLTVDGSLSTQASFYRVDIPVRPGCEYTFCAFVNNLVIPSEDFPDPIINVFINGTQVSTITLSENPDIWDLITFDWMAIANHADIELRFGGVNSLGFDLAIDDISFHECRPSVCMVGPNNCFADFVNISTGINHQASSLFDAGDFDPYWNIISTPEVMPLPHPANVINAFSVGNWAEFMDSKWLSVNNDFIYFSNNPAPDPAHLFERCFETCGDKGDSSNVKFEFELLFDDVIRVYLVDELGTEVFEFVDNDVVSTQNFKTPTQIDETIRLAPGKYCLRVELRNILGQAMGFNLNGIISGGTLLNTLCSQNYNLVSGAVFNDGNQDSNWTHYSTDDITAESGLEGWTVYLCDASSTPVYSTTTDQFGFYQFRNILPGDYLVKIELMPGYLITSKDSVYPISISKNGILLENNFGVASTVNTLEIDYLGQISFFPNPARQELNLSFTERTSKGLQVSIQSIDGKILWREKLSLGILNQQIDIGSLPKGIYIIHLLDETGAMWARKFVKQ